MDSAVIFEVREKEVAGTVRPPGLVSESGTGFPQHKKRTGASKFKQQKQAEARDVSAATDPSPSAGLDGRRATGTDKREMDMDKRGIDTENRERLRNMSPQDIEEARQELFSQLDPSLIQTLLKRANIDEVPAGPSPFDEDGRRPMAATGPLPDIKVEDTSETGKKQQEKKYVSFAEDALEDTPDEAPDAPDAPPPSASPDNVDTGHDGIHFPSAKVPDLDPSDPDFLENLHGKYFPNLPADPSRLAWMAPVPTEGSPADRDSPYYPGQSSLPVSQLRFDFRGRLLPPRLSRAIPSTRGLHHHGEAPEAAGYTVAELARLARSVVPAQRCLAFQTLGRILYRLGRGEWGGTKKNSDGDGLAVGLWSWFRDGRVLDTLHEAAAVEEGSGHRGSRAYAIEAIWLLEKGGWKNEWKGR